MSHASLVPCSLVPCPIPDGPQDLSVLRTNCPHCIGGLMRMVLGQQWAAMVNVVCSHSLADLDEDGGCTLNGRDLLVEESTEGRVFRRWHALNPSPFEVVREWLPEFIRPALDKDFNLF